MKPEKCLTFKVFIYLQFFKKIFVILIQLVENCPVSEEGVKTKKLANMELNGF